ncbi:MAG: radical SAM protein [Candidatus Nanoarchaeia archaeon]|nr:radical SAM protein [Candidatus Nanoarchaeia archaeon]
MVKTDTLNHQTFLKGNGSFTEEEFRLIASGQDPTNKMITLGLTLGPGCNLDCFFCYNHGGISNSGREINRDEWMSLDYYISAIDQAADLGAKSVVLVGIGETLKDPNVTNLIERIYHKNMTPLVITNVTDCIDSYMASFLFDHKTSVYASVHAITDKLYNQITRTEGMLRKTLIGIENCLKAGYGKVWTENGQRVTDIAINTIVMGLNYHEIPKIKEYCNDKGILFVARPPEMAGSAEKEWERKIVGDVSFGKLVDVSKQNTEASFTQTEHGCLYWATGIILYIDGSARFCFGRPPPKSDKDIGNIKIDSLDLIIDRKRELYPLSDKMICPMVPK